MRRRHILGALALVLAAVLLQTTAFAPNRIQPFGAGPDLVLLVVLACSRHLDAEPALLVGFTAGFLVDLLGASPLGLWAMALTVVAYAVIRLRDREVEGPFLLVGVFALTLLGETAFVALGTLFGQQTLLGGQVLRKVLLAGVYNVLLAVPILWGTARLLAAGPSRRWAR